MKYTSLWEIQYREAPLALFEHLHIVLPYGSILMIDSCRVVKELLGLFRRFPPNEKLKVWPDPNQEKCRDSYYVYWNKDVQVGIIDLLNNFKPSAFIEHVHGFKDGFLMFWYHDVWSPGNNNPLFSPFISRDDIDLFCKKLNVGYSIGSSWYDWSMNFGERSCKWLYICLDCRTGKHVKTNELKTVILCPHCQKTMSELPFTENIPRQSDDKEWQKLAGFLSLMNGDDTPHINAISHEDLREIESQIEQVLSEKHSKRRNRKLRELRRKKADMEKRSTEPGT